MTSPSGLLVRQQSKTPDPESDPATERLLKDARIEEEIPTQKATIIPKTLFFAEGIRKTHSVIPTHTLNWTGFTTLFEYAGSLLSDGLV